MNTIAAHWESYRAEVLPEDAGLVQITECRRAFYAGAQAMINLYAVIAEPSVSEDAGMAMISGFLDESRRFGEEVGAGRA